MSTQRAKPERPFVSLRWKLVIGFSLVFTVIFTGSYYWFYAFSTERALERIRSDLHDTLQGAAAGLDGASLRILAEEGEVNADGFSDHALYRDQLAWFATVQSLEPRAWPFTYVAGTETDTIYALADLWALHDPSKAYRFGEVEHDAGPMIAGLSASTFDIPRQGRCAMERSAYEGAFFGAVRGQLVYASCLLTRRVGYTDAHGSWVSAFQPVRDADGVLTGAIGIDFEMAYVDQVQDAILDRVLHAFVLTYLTLLLLVLLMARYVTTPVIRLTSLVARVGEGAYDQDFGTLRTSRWRDEIGQLAAAFEAMTEQVRQREQTLQREVRQLRIVIDERKRSQDVLQIVETDFFRDLQEKAQRFRQRNLGGSDTSE